MISHQTTPGVSHGANWFWKRLLDVVAALIPAVAEWRRQSAKQHRQLGVEALSAGDQPAAIAHLMSAIDRDPGNPGYYCDLGQVYYEAKDYAQAKELYKTALKHDYSDLRALKGLGYSLQALKEYDEAIYVYLRFLHQEPQERDVVLNLAVVLHNLGKNEEAVEYYTQAQKLDPENASIPENRGRALYSAGKIDDAIACLIRTLEMNPNNAEAHKFLAYAWEAKGDTEQALKSCMTALEQDPHDGSAHMYIAFLLGKLGKYREGVEHASAAAKIYERSQDTTNLAWAYWEVGWDYYKLGNWAKSIEASRNAVQLQPALFNARFNLALALLHDNQQKDALEEYRRGVEDVTLASDLKQWAIDDLRDALQRRPDLLGAAESLQMLEKRYDDLGKDHGLSSIATSSAAS